MLNYSANGPSGYNLTNSLRFRASAAAYLNRTPASASNRTTWTWSGWVKRGFAGGPNVFTLFFAESGGNTNARIEYLDTGQFRWFYQVAGVDTAYTASNALYRDFSAWYHVVYVYDSTQATAANRQILYVNGVQTTNASVITPAQNTVTSINNTVTHWIGKNNTPEYFDGYLTEVNFIDGQALTPSSFGNTNSVTGVWQPAKYTGTYGTNGFYLNFNSIALTSGSNTGLGKDNSGNGNYWNTNNISVTAGTTYDAMTDVPTLTSATVANYCVLNPLNGAGSITNANLTHAGSGANWYSAASTIAFDASANFYAEVTIISNNAVANGIQLGVIGSAQALSNNTSQLGSYATGYAWQSYVSGGLYNKYNNGVGGNYNTLATYTTNDVIGIQLNAGTLTFYKNNVSQGSAYTGLSGSFCFGGSPYSSDTVAWNFGQRPFAYTPPTGSVALNTYNLPSSTIPQGNKYMDATLYTGNGSTQTITNAAGFKPDFVWTKARNTAYSHVLYDSVRGTGTTKALYSDATSAEGASTGYQNLTSYNSNGWSVGSTSSTNILNANGDTFVGWQWQAGQGSTSSNTSGTITSTTSVNATAGFSVVTYTGTGANATCGHGLGVIPSMVIWKNRTGTDTWIVYHSALTTSEYLVLASTAAKATYSGLFTGISSTLLPLNAASAAINASANNYVAYCWAEIAGFSKFGSYTGNGSADGPFIYTGFRPKFIMIKKTSSTGNWILIDTSRNTYNTADLDLFSNLSNAEASGEAIDILSNGFKLKYGGAGDTNASGATYIYIAYAENPFKNALAR